MARTIVIMHRRGGAASNEVTGASFTARMASVFNGKGDLLVTVVNGVVQAVTPKPNRDWELFDYTLGEFAAVTGGFGWGGTPALPQMFRAPVGTEYFDTYAVGPATDLTGGTGWAEAPLIAAY